MVSIDLDQQIPESFQASSAASLTQNSVKVSTSETDETLPSAAKITKKTSNTTTSNSAESKKLSIVLTKEMHRRAKMQAVQEDTTLKDLVVRLIEQHLDQKQ